MLFAKCLNFFTSGILRRLVKVYAVAEELYLSRKVNRKKDSTPHGIDGESLLPEKVEILAESMSTEALYEIPTGNGSILQGKSDVVRKGFNVLGNDARKDEDVDDESDHVQVPILSSSEWAGQQSPPKRMRLFEGESMDHIYNNNSISPIEQPQHIPTPDMSAPSPAVFDGLPSNSSSPSSGGQQGWLDRDMDEELGSICEAGPGNLWDPTRALQRIGNPNYHELVSNTLRRVQPQSAESYRDLPLITAFRSRSRDRKRNVSSTVTSCSKQLKSIKCKLVKAVKMLHKVREIECETGMHFLGPTHIEPESCAFSSPLDPLGLGLGSASVPWAAENTLIPGSTNIMGTGGMMYSPPALFSATSVTLPTIIEGLSAGNSFQLPSVEVPPLRNASDPPKKHSGKRALTANSSYGLPNSNEWPAPIPELSAPRLSLSFTISRFLSLFLSKDFRQVDLYAILHDDVQMELPPVFSPYGSTNITTTAENTLMLATQCLADPNACFLRSTVTHSYFVKNLSDAIMAHCTFTMVVARLLPQIPSVIAHKVSTTVDFNANIGKPISENELSSEFYWRTAGLIAAGCNRELGANGTVICTVLNSKISKVKIEFKEGSIFSNLPHGTSSM